MSAKDTARRGGDAQVCLDLLKRLGVMETIEQTIVKRLKSLPLDAANEDYRLKLNLLLTLHEMFERQIYNLIGSGQVADKELDRRSIRNRRGL